ncbi:MAG: acyl-CoA dehydrogenase family protein [Actinomycetota bacterium]|nr:acyl-CoA dehydrogenase family protein [Actinomycetota bacterium]MED5173075.1 acyl-CoA dehydrogenase family protein [Actinomycetota bacterium]
MNAITPQTVRNDATKWYEQNWDPQLPLGHWWNILADSGWAFPSWPQGFGGRALPAIAARAALQARRDVGAFGPPNGVATFLAAPTIMHYGTPAQQEKYLPRIVKGQDLWCQLFSEPGAGSDMAGLGTRAVRDGDEWVINGQKVWNSGAQWAKYGILIARTDPEQPKHRGITYFLVDMQQQGVDVRPLREMTGDAAFNEVFLNDARVADSDRLGDLGDGWRVAMTTLSHERNPDNPGMGDTAAFGSVDLEMTVEEHRSGLASKIDGFSLALSGGVTRVLEDVTNQFNALNEPVARQKMAQLIEMRRNSKWSGMRAATSLKSGGQPGPEVSTLKLLGSEMGRRIRDLGLNAMGPYGMLYGEDAPAGGLFHAYSMFTPAQSIAGGSDEVQRNIVAERVHGLPREPGEKDQRELPWSELRRS